MSTVIKAGSGPVNTDRVAFNYRDVTDNAERYLEGVRKEAEEILSQAHERTKRSANRRKYRDETTRKSGRSKPLMSRLPQK